MKFGKRIAAALMFVALTLAGCGSEAGSAGFAPTAADKKAVMKAGGEAVQYQEYRYFYLNNKRDRFGEDAVLTAEDVAVLKELTEANVLRRHALTAMAKEYGAKLTVEQADRAEATVESYRASCGDDEAYREALDAQYLTDALFRDLTLEGELAEAVYLKMADKGLIDESEEARDRAFASDEILCLKEIYIAVGSRELDDFARQRAEEVYAKLKRGGSFTELMKEYSSYSQTELPPETGYYTMKNDALDAVWDAAVQLKTGEYSPVVESPYGYHIVLRCEKDPAYMSSHAAEIFYNYTHAKFYDFYNAKIASLKYEYTSYGKKLDFALID